MALVVRKATAVAVERESLFAMMVPISGIFWMGSYKHPSVPWPDMLGIGLSHLGYTLGAAAVVAGHFNILGLHRRSSTIAAALAFFIAGTVLANVDALASAPWVFFPFLFIVSVIFLVIGVVPAASGKISSYFSTVRDVRRFKRLIEEVSAEETVDRSVKTLHAVWTGERTKEDALKEFAALLITLKRIAAVLERYGYAGTAAKAKLIDLYWALIRNQAGLRVGTTYIPAAALYDPNLLALLLEAEADGANIAITAFDYCAGKPRRR